MMRKIQLPFTQTQKVRYERAIERLQSLSSTVNSDASVIVTDTIPVNHEDAFLKGHGTSEVDGELLATVCGVVERVDKLVYVRTLRARYKPEVGDIVVGRVIEVCCSKRWRVELNFTQDGVLMLSSMNMPDGSQVLFVISSPDFECMLVYVILSFSVLAELRTIQHDGSLQLHARSHKYGKRSKHHFHYIESLGIDLIIGCNGFIWVGEHVEVRDPVMMIDDQKDDEMIISSSSTTKERSHTPLETRQNICRIGNAIRVLSNLGFTVTVEVITETVNLSNSKNVDIYDMLESEFHVMVAESEAERRRQREKVNSHQ
ncbi:hypothetical protein Bca52824_062006 [Brassica carinata]|uniref:Uncharacterized protein n=1 Tax=Brassica carinata TaxID=52824 RepID=A0A8X7U7T4_BRACI|nr:hypothetical protein Bca52824_062006 [Brassica carinata]